MTLHRDKVGIAVRTVIADVLGIPHNCITDRTDLRAEYGIDSLEVMAVAAQLERVLELRVAVEALVQVRTVGDAVDALTDRQEAGV
ncbi:acyl carrier protein [Streptomyces sp. NPDC005728]|uniref:acyl carrier protein n=1 Tax=Streptomyces sp. NPDC005728 TaxID=3157054 RepID=UPI0033F3103C